MHPTCIKNYKSWLSINARGELITKCQGVQRIHIYIYMPVCVCVCVCNNVKTVPWSSWHFVDVNITLKSPPTLPPNRHCCRRHPTQSEPSPLTRRQRSPQRTQHDASRYFHSPTHTHLLYTGCPRLTTYANNICARNAFRPK